MKGIVLRFNRKHGYGFIEPADQTNTVFVHVKELPLYHRYLREGSVVEYRPDIQPDGRVQARSVQIISEPGAVSAVATPVQGGADDSQS